MTKKKARREAIGGDFGRQSLKDISSARTEIAATRRQLAGRLRERRGADRPKRSAVEKTRSISPEDELTLTDETQGALKAAECLRLSPVHTIAEGLAGLNRPTLALLGHFLETLHSGQSRIVLQWPVGQRDVSLLHPLAMLASLCPREYHTSDGGMQYCTSAKSFRTLYFPWKSGTTLASQRSLLIGRHEIVDWNKYHLTRLNLMKEKEELHALHMTLGHLNSLSKRENTKLHLAHPVLAEIYSSYSAEGEEFSKAPFRYPAAELLWRVSFGASLNRQIDYRSQLEAPESAPFGLFGISEDFELKKALRAGALQTRVPDVCLLDLGPPALRRLGPDWLRTIKKFVSETRKRFADVAFCAFTHDPYVHSQLAKILARRKDVSAPYSTVLFRLTQDPLSEDPLIESFSEIKAQFNCYSGPVVDAIQALAAGARKSRYPHVANVLLRELRNLRKAATTPIGIRDSYEVLCNSLGQAQTESFLEQRSRATALASIEDVLESAIGGPERARVKQVREGILEAFNSLETETPIGGLLAELARSDVFEHGRSIIAFPTSEDEELGKKRLLMEARPDSSFPRTFNASQVLLTNRECLDEVLEQCRESTERDEWALLCIVAPTHGELARIASKPWLPRELLVLSDARFAIRVAQQYRHFSSSFEGTEALRQLRQRLSALADASQAEATARSVATIDFEMREQPLIETSERVVDLTDGSEDGTEELLVLSLGSSRQIRARPGSILVRLDSIAQVNPFQRVRADEIQQDDIVVVPDQAFANEAKEIVSIRILAENWIDVYHSLVESRVSSISGSTLSEKSRYVLKEIQSLGAKTRSESAVRDWLNVASHKDLPPETRTPHAPQDSKSFEAFLSVIGIEQSISQRIWVEGIQPLRIDRRRAGQRVAQAFVSFLVDPHGNAGRLGATERERVSDLRAKALEHVDQVITVERFESGAISGEK